MKRDADFSVKTNVVLIHFDTLIISTSDALMTSSWQRNVVRQNRQTERGYERVTLLISHGRRSPKVIETIVRIFDMT